MDLAAAAAVALSQAGLSAKPPAWPVHSGSGSAVVGITIEDDSVDDTLCSSSPASSAAAGGAGGVKARVEAPLALPRPAAHFGITDSSSCSSGGGGGGGGRAAALAAVGTFVQPLLPSQSQAEPLVPLGTPPRPTSSSATSGSSAGPLLPALRLSVQMAEWEMSGRLIEVAQPRR